MPFIPGSSAEVKSIIEAVDCTSRLRWSYLKGDRGVCEIPWDVSEDDPEELPYNFDGVITDRSYPDVKTNELDPEDVFPGASRSCGGHFFYFERKVKPGEVTDLRLAIWRARAAVEANPRENMPVEITLQDPRRDNVVQMPAPEKPTVRYNRPAHEVLKYFHEAPIGEELKRMYYVMYKKSRYAPLCETGGYPGKSKKKARCYNQGNEELARSTGLHKNTVSKYLMKMKKLGMIKLHKRGWPGEKCSIWELPFDLAHVFAWKRQVKKYS